MFFQKRTHDLFQELKAGMGFLGYIKAILAALSALLRAELQSGLDTRNNLRKVAVVVLRLNGNDLERPCWHDAKGGFAYAPKQVLLNARGGLADTGRANEQHSPFPA